VCVHECVVGVVVAKRACELGRSVRPNDRENKRREIPRFLLFLSRRISSISLSRVRCVVSCVSSVRTPMSAAAGARMGAKFLGFEAVATRSRFGCVSRVRCCASQWCGGAGAAGRLSPLVHRRQYHTLFLNCSTDHTQHGAVACRLVWRTRHDLVTSSETHIHHLPCGGRPERRLSDASEAAGQSSSSSES
jgi:hypothetical protein